MTCRAEILNCVKRIIANKGYNEFTIREVQLCMEAGRTRYTRSAISTHVGSLMCSNAPQNHPQKFHDFERVKPGLYRLIGSAELVSDGDTAQPRVARGDSADGATIQEITIPPIRLAWSRWFEWDRLNLDARNDSRAVNVPSSPGVYEAKCLDQEESLTIGKASDLRMRVKQGPVKGTVPHSSGIKIRQQEDTSRILVRWAVTDRPAAVEEELHIAYLARYRRLPKHTDRT